MELYFILISINLYLKVIIYIEIENEYKNFTYLFISDDFFNMHQIISSNFEAVNFIII